MFGRSFQIVRVFGIPIKVDPSWLVILALVTWALAAGTFPLRYPSLPAIQHWGMGFAAALLLFACVLAHELSHALVAQRADIPIRGITLFLFGGVAEMIEEPRSPKVELAMAAAGPAMSVLLGFLAWGAGSIVAQAGGPVQVSGVLTYLGVINVVLAVFNLLPGFPLDGGRILRASLWWWKGDIRSATRIATSVGAGLGIALMLLGIFTALTGALIAGLWEFFIGMFLRAAARSADQQLAVRLSLEGVKVEELMTRDVVAVPEGATLQEAVDQYVRPHRHHAYPVVQAGAAVGILSTEQIAAVPKAERGSVRVRDVMSRDIDGVVLPPEAEAADALQRVLQEPRKRLLVLDHGRLRGIVSAQDVIRFIEGREAWAE
ncbi:site-2 protease family protein [Myxococcota bacterium]|nr:site-2 protease family protein [Myxococcota bacterium]